MQDRKKKALLVLPLIVAPFLVFICWILGIVGPAEARASDGAFTRGINVSLPAAMPSADSSWDKLRFYEQADKDSAKLVQWRRLDPYLQAEAEPLRPHATEARYRPYSSRALNQADEEERKAYERINAIHAQLERPTVRVQRAAPVSPPVSVDGANVDRLERMMQAMQADKPAEDPEVAQLQQLLQSIQDVQHPERVSERLRASEQPQKVFNVSVAPQRESSPEVPAAGNRFYSMDDRTDEVTAGGISAVVHETQSVGTGDLVRLRLTQNVLVKDVPLPENNFLYGAAKIEGNRLLVHVSFVVVNGGRLPVSLDVVGADGLTGIPLHASAAATVGSETADRTTQGLSLGGIPHSFGAQVADAVVQTGKQLLKKQTKPVRYTVPAGYVVQLVNNIN
jgi:conjugative transposon TraM protein